LFITIRLQRENHPRRTRDEDDDIVQVFRQTASFRACLTYNDRRAHFVINACSTRAHGRVAARRRACACIQQREQQQRQQRRRAQLAAQLAAACSWR
jgi:hypothetical protein